MKKTYIFILIAIAVIIAGVLIGLFIGNRSKTSDLEPKQETKLAENTQNLKNEIEIVTTSNMEIKTSPNCLFVFRTNYKGCKHTVVERNEIPEECVNKTEEDLQEKYRDWKIEEFTSLMVSFYKDEEGICLEHYILKDDNGYVAVYQIDSFGKETLKEKTEIVTLYLPETDKLRLKEGIKVNGKEELNAAIEDYE